MTTAADAFSDAALAAALASIAADAAMTAVAAASACWKTFPVFGPLAFQGGVLAATVCELKGVDVGALLDNIVDEASD